MSQDLRREREMGTEQQFLGNNDSPVWRSVAQLESRNAALTAEVEKLKAELAKKNRGFDFAAEEQRQRSRAEGLESKLLRLGTYIKSLEAGAASDESYAKTSFPGGTELRDDLFSRYQAANRAGVARRIVKGLREVLALPDEPKLATRYWRVPTAGGPEYYRLDASGRPVVWSTIAKRWVTSVLFPNFNALGTVATPIDALPAHILAELPDGGKP